MGDVAQHFLTLSTGLIRQQLADLAERDATVASEARIVGTHTRRLHTQCKARQPGVVDFKGLGRWLSDGTREQFRSNDRAHVKILPR
jgi:hypothetical protein